MLALEQECCPRLSGTRGKRRTEDRQWTSSSRRRGWDWAIRRGTLRTRGSRHVRSGCGRQCCALLTPHPVAKIVQ